MTKRQRTTRRLQVAFVLMCVIVGAALGLSPSLASGSSQVAAHAIVQQHCSVAVDDGFAVVRSNTTWTVAVLAENGGSRLVTGAPTDGARIDLAPGECIEMVAR